MNIIPLEEVLTGKFDPLKSELEGISWKEIDNFPKDEFVSLFTVPRLKLLANSLYIEKDILRYDTSKPIETTNERLVHVH